MSTLPSYTPKKLIKLLRNKGFILDRSSGSHQVYMLSDRTKRVIVPKHNKDIPKGTLLSILKQADIDKEEL